MPILDARKHQLFINRRSKDEKGRKLIETVGSAMTKADALRILKACQENDGKDCHYYVSVRPAKVNYTLM